MADRYGRPLYNPELINDNDFMTNIVEILNKDEYYHGTFGQEQNLQLLADRLADAKKYHKPGLMGAGHSPGRLERSGYEKRHPVERV